MHMRAILSKPAKFPANCQVLAIGAVNECVYPSSLMLQGAHEFAGLRIPNGYTHVEYLPDSKVVSVGMPGQDGDNKIVIEGAEVA